MTEAVRRRVPDIACWTDVCYRRATRLSFGTHTIESETGVQQGDPLGPELFAITLHEAITDALQELEIDGLRPDLSLFYLDDGAVGGHQASVSKLAEKLKMKWAEIGLEMAENKRHVYPAAPGVTDINTDMPTIT